MAERSREAVRGGRAGGGVPFDLGSASEVSSRGGLGSEACRLVIRGSRPPTAVRAKPQRELLPIYPYIPEACGLVIRGKQATHLDLGHNKSCCTAEQLVTAPLRAVANARPPVGSNPAADLPCFTYSRGRR
jgi:hypothetical protein